MKKILQLLAVIGLSISIGQSFAGEQYWLRSFGSVRGPALSSSSEDGLWEIEDWYYD